MVVDISDGVIKHEIAQQHIASSVENIYNISAKDITDSLGWNHESIGVDPENVTKPAPYVLDGQLQHSLKNLYILPGQNSTVKYKGGEYGITLDTEGKLTLSDVAHKKQYTLGHILIKKIDKSGSGVLKLMKSFGKKIHIDTMKFYAISGGACGLCIDIGDLKQGPEQSVWNNLFVGQYVIERILEAIRLGEDSVLINLNNTQTKKAIEGFKKIPPEKGYPPGTSFRDIKIEVMKMFQGIIDDILVVEFFFKKDD